MSGKAFGWAREQACSGGLAAKAVLLLIADYANPEDGTGEHQAFPSVPTMAAELQASERTVQRAIASLEADGLIARELRTTASGKKTSSRYVLAMPPPRGRDRCQPDTSGGDRASPSEVTERHHPPVTASPSTTFEPLPEPSERADALSPSAREFDELVGATFEQVLAAFAEASPTSVARPRDWAAWQKAVETVHPAKLGAAAVRYLAHVKAAGANGRSVHVFSLARWLGDAKWEPFLAAAPAAAATTSPARTPFEGPPELMALLGENRQHDWPAFLAGSRWDAATRTIVCRFASQKRELETWCGTELRRREAVKIETEAMRERSA